MHYAPKTKENQQLSQLIIHFSFRSKNSGPKEFKSQAPQRKVLILDTSELSCKIQIALQEFFRSESNSFYEVSSGFAFSVTERQISEFDNSKIFEWKVGPETDRRFLEWWASAQPYSVAHTFFEDEYGLELNIVVCGHWNDKEVNKDA